MKLHLTTIVAAGLLAGPLTAQAGETADDFFRCAGVRISVTAESSETTADFVVHHAYCDLCPSIVKGVLAKVEGVKAVEVGERNSVGDMTAEVVYDHALTTPAALVAATTNAGYPADIRETTSSK